MKLETPPVLFSEQAPPCRLKEPRPALSGELKDDNDTKDAPRAPIPFEIETLPSEVDIGIRFKGYGLQGLNPNTGYQIVIEHCENELRVIIYANINQDAPTHVISLEGALETARALAEDYQSGDDEGSTYEYSSSGQVSITNGV